MMYRWGPWDYGSSWEMWVFMILMVILVAAIVVAIVYVGRGYTGSRSVATTSAPQPTSPGIAPPAGTGESPQDILKRRYAAGEIDRDEYLQKLSDLEPR